MRRLKKAGRSARFCGLLAVCLAALIEVPAQSLILRDSVALGQASGQGQAHSRARSVVSRVAFRYIVGSVIDLPLTLRPCPTAEERDAAYDIVRKIIAGERADRAMQKALCHPHFGQSLFTNADAGSLTFDLPSKYCAEIKSSIDTILENRSEKSYTQILDRPKQGEIRRVFDMITLYGGRHIFPNSTDTGHSKYFAFLPQDCVIKGERAQFVILMHRRKRAKEEQNDTLSVSVGGRL
ncbi:MAG: hypothetical protein E6G97_22650 [Alphaproteobacteria bacterium]|nr:MAG: hypothetical protein E6G97_22650 [Alphaproteobacteria bacterium]